MPEKIAAKPVPWIRVTQFAIITMAVIAVAAALEATGEIAVPICTALVFALTLGPASDRLSRLGLPPVTGAIILVIVLGLVPAGASARSEERRVGKECVSTGISRWWPYN